MKKPALLAAEFFMVWTILGASSAPVCPSLMRIFQPDGTSFFARSFGNAQSQVVETLDGFTILKNHQSGFWFYAEKDRGGDLVPCRMAVGSIPLPAHPRHLRGDSGRNRMPGFESGADRLPGVNLIGELPLLVILVEFLDVKLIGSTATSWKNSFFGTANSVKDYFAEASYDQLSIIPAKETHGTANDGIIKIRLNMKHPNTAENVGDKINKEVARKALVAANKYVNFSKLDGDMNGSLSRSELLIFIVWAGYDMVYGGTASAKTPAVWCHSSAFSPEDVPAPQLDGVKLADSLSDGAYCQFGEWHQATFEPKGQRATIGKLCWSVCAGSGKIPDLYDTDGTSQGIGEWGLMGKGLWNSSKIAGDTPSHPEAWSKYFLGWIVPVTWKGANKTWTIEPAETTKTNAFLLLGNNPEGPEIGGSGEYFLLENRQKIGYDRALPGFGLLIWHIEESRTDNNDERNLKNYHRLIDLEEADGLNELNKPGYRGDDGDPFPGVKNKTEFTGVTKPNSKWYRGADSKVRIRSIKVSGTKISAVVSTQGGA
jgi:M6 family metalloprotease-like protein